MDKYLKAKFPALVLGSLALGVPAYAVADACTQACFTTFKGNVEACVNAFKEVPEALKECLGGATATLQACLTTCNKPQPNEFSMSNVGANGFMPPVDPLGGAIALSVDIDDPQLHVSLVEFYIVEFDPGNAAAVSNLIGFDNTPGDGFTLAYDPASDPLIGQNENVVFLAVAVNATSDEIDAALAVAGVSRSIGLSYCGPAVANSSGQPGVISAFGSDLVYNDLRLDANQLPMNQFGYFVSSTTQAYVFPVPNSQGALCVGGLVGRHTSGVFDSGPSGSGSLVLDLTQMPTPLGPLAVLPGDTWNFTCWHRDLNPGSTSNFTDAVSVTFD